MKLISKKNNYSGMCNTGFFRIKPLQNWFQSKQLPYVKYSPFVVFCALFKTVIQFRILYYMTYTWASDNTEESPIIAGSDAVLDAPSGATVRVLGLNPDDGGPNIGLWQVHIDAVVLGVELRVVVVDIREGDFYYSIAF